MISDREEKNIFNVDELGLFCQCVPNETLSFKNESCKGGKLSKQRATTLVGSNMDGSEKLTLLMIGKTANTRCFKKLKKKCTEHAANKKAWMTRII